MATKITIGTGNGGLGTSSYTLKGLISLIASGTVIDHIGENPNSQAYIQEVLMANGVNTIAVPNKSGALIIVPLKDADFILQFKGSGAAPAAAVCHDFHLAAPIVLPFNNPPPANVYLTWGGVKWWETPVTITNGTDLVNLAAHNIADNSKVMFTADIMPTPLESKVIYYKRPGGTGNDFKVALTSGGAAIDLTTDGTNVKLYTMCQYKFFWI